MRAELTSEELVTGCLERIEAREGAMGAWAFLDTEAALRQARERDAEPPRSGLHGVPVAIKDIFDTADMPTECGSPIHAGRRPERDAECVRRLREAGAVVLGKTVTTEFATYQPPRTVHPLDPERTPGGSSSGSAAAVADGMVPLALASQTAGSTIRPAAYCGVVGFKPTFGAVDLTGALQLSARLDTIGLMARGAGDVALLLDALTGDVPAARRVERPSLALVRTGSWERADASGQAAVEGAAELLERAGAIVEERELPDPFSELTAAQETIMAVDASRSLAEERAHHDDQLSEPLRALLERGETTSESDYRDAVELAERCRERAGEAFAGADAILTPAATGEAPTRETTGDPVFCRAWTLLGTPAVSVPGLTGEHGLPIGVQLVAPHGADRELLALAEWAAQAFERQQ